MNKFKVFKKALNCKEIELAEITGYTRQGLRHAFANIDHGCEPSRKFATIINSVVDTKIEEERARHEARIEELRQQYIGRTDNVIRLVR